MNGAQPHACGAGAVASDFKPRTTPGEQRPIRILAISSTWQGANDYAFVRAFRRAGHSVTVISDEAFFPSGWRKPTLKALRRIAQPLMSAEYERTLVAEAQRHRPQLFFVFKGRFVTAAAVDAIRATGAVAINFYPDIDFIGQGANIAKAITRYDWVFTTKSFHLTAAKADLDKTKASFLPHAYDPETHALLALEAEDRARYACEASFIGAWSPKKEKLLGYVRRALPNLGLKIWGNDWERAKTDFGGAVMRQPVLGVEYAKAIRASAISVAILREERPGYASGDLTTARTFEIPAAGGFMLHERTVEAQCFFAEDAECAMFADGEELAAKVEHYLAHPEERRQITEAGRRRCGSSGYSVDDRVASVIDKVFEIKQWRARSQLICSLPPASTVNGD